MPVFQRLRKINLIDLNREAIYLQAEVERKVSGFCRAPPGTLGWLPGMERVSAQMQPEPWNQMTSWGKGSRTSETLLTDRQLSFLSWVWEFQWDIWVTKQIQPSSHHGKATMSPETQITGCLLAATGASTPTILQAFSLPLVKTDHFGRDFSSRNSYSVSILKPFPLYNLHPGIYSPHSYRFLYM